MSAGNFLCVTLCMSGQEGSNQPHPHPSPPTHRQAGDLTVLFVKSLSRSTGASCPLASNLHGLPWTSIRLDYTLLSRPGFGISVAGLKYQIYPYYILAKVGQ